MDPSDLHAIVEVRDVDVREAFVRIAYYDRATGRPRQIALSDAPVVRAGDTASLDVPLDPPAGAIAYRVRVLARLVTPTAVSLPDAVRADLAAPALRRTGAPRTRLLW